MPPPGAGEPAGGGRAGRALAATIIASSMAFIDSSVVNVALSSIQRHLAADLAALQWVVNAYLLLLASLVLVGGAFGDRFGRRTVFAGGIALFTLASVLCGLAQTVGQLIAARALQGVGGAMLVPSSLAIISTLYDGEARRRALGTWTGAGALTTALGPALGGWLVDSLSWRAIFFINLPLALMALWLAWGAVPNGREATVRPLDWPGAALVTAGLGALTYGLIALPAQGIAAPGVAGSLLAALVLLAGFCVVEVLSPTPMVRPQLFRSATFTGTNLMTFLLYAGLGGTFFFLPLMLIRGQGYAATMAGAALLPFSAIMGTLSRPVAVLAGRVGARTTLVVGPILAAAGFAWLGLAAGNDVYATGILPGIVLLALGMTASIAQINPLIMGSVDARDGGIASGINTAVARTASLLAVALLGILFLDRYEASRTLALSARGLPPQSLSNPLEAMTAETDPLLLLIDREAMAAAFRAVELAAAACALGAAALSAAMIGRADAQPQPARASGRRPV